MGLSKKFSIGTPTKQRSIYGEQTRMTRLSPSSKGTTSSFSTSSSGGTSPSHHKRNLTIQTGLDAKRYGTNGQLTPSGRKSVVSNQSLKKKLSHMKKRTPPTPKANYLTPSSASRLRSPISKTFGSTIQSTSHKNSNNTTTTTTTTTTKIQKKLNGRSTVTGTRYSWNRHEQLSFGIKTHEPAENLLIPQSKRSKGKKTLVLDLDETLIHSSFVPIQHPDYIIPFSTSDGHKGIAYVKKRPGVDEFMKRVGELFECVIFTASLKLYAKPLLDIFDRYNVIEHRLYRHHCSFDGYTYKKDLTKLGRDISQTLLLDNSSISYELQPQNGMPCASWYDSPLDNSLLEDVLPWLEKIAKAKDVYDTLKDYKRKVKIREPEPPR